MLFTWLYNMVQDPTIRGQLYLKVNADSAEVPALSHIVEFGDAEFSANAQGRWVLRAPKLGFGKITVSVYEPRGHGLLGRVDVCLPLPIVGAVLPAEQPRIVYREDTHQLSVIPGCVAGVTPAHAAQAPRAAAMTSRLARFRITGIELRSTGHSKKPAEVYLVVRSGKTVLPTPGLPSRKFSDSWLLLQDNRRVSPDNLWFEAGPTQGLRIEVWNHDSKPWNSDDLLAVFDLPPSSVTASRGRPVTFVDQKRQSTLVVAVE